MGWIIALLLLILTGLGLVLLGRVPRSLRELVGAALLLGLAGYAWQGHPNLGGDPRDPAKAPPRFDEDLAKLRDSFSGGHGKAAPWLIMSDGFARQGKSEDAANVILSGLRAEPNNADLWVGLGNALVAHGNGIVSPAAEYSYRQAMRLAPQSSAAPYFHGLAFAQSGQYDEARKIWAALAAHVPEQSPLYVELQANLVQLDHILARQSRAGP